jgi:hypothetical protein
MLIALLAIFIGACNTATEQKSVDSNEANQTTSEKTDQNKLTDDKKDETTSASSDTPTDKKDETTSATSDALIGTLKTFVAAVKAEDEAAIKNILSEKTVKILDLTAKMKGISFYENLTVRDKKGELKELPETQNEKIAGDKATIEVKGKSDKTWNTISFVKEDGRWKIAFFDDQYDRDYETLKKEMEGRQPN